jgi:hypothetical protein
MEEVNMSLKENSKARLLQKLQYLVAVVAKKEAVVEEQLI